jgi:hypothetical protein
MRAVAKTESPGEAMLRAAVFEEVLEDLWIWFQPPVGDSCRLSSGPPDH